MRPRSSLGPGATTFDPGFLERSPLFWPIAPAARALFEARSGAGATEPGVTHAMSGPHAFPPVESFHRVFERAPGASRLPPPVRFEAAVPRPRRRARRRQAIDPRSLYDARITLEGIVPTRERSWHDLMNALVWGTFPRTKRALHARQHRAIAERLVPGATTLPPSRTRELDALALLDEGGVVLPTGDPAHAIIFGHAIYESLAQGIPPAVVAAIDLGIRPAVVAAIDPARPASLESADRLSSSSAQEPLAGSPQERLLAAIDAALSTIVEDAARLRTPEELRRVDLANPALSTPPIAWATHRPL